MDAALMRGSSKMVAVLVTGACKECEERAQKIGAQLEFWSRPWNWNRS